MKVTVTPTRHERAEWSRLAQAAYSQRRNNLGHQFSAAGALPDGAEIPPARFDALQAVYRAWLVFGFDEISAADLQALESTRRAGLA